MNQCDHRGEVFLWRFDHRPSNQPANKVHHVDYQLFLLVAHYDMLILVIPGNFTGIFPANT